MTQQFILDENVVILAQLGQDDSGAADLTCLNIITGIIRICHTIILDPVLMEKHLTQLNRLRSASLPLDPTVVAILMDAFRIDGKVQLRPIAQPFPEEMEIPAGSQDDIEIVRLAVQSGAVLVTTDLPLREDLHTSGVAQQYGLTVLSPEEALNAL